ncbi:MAG: PEP-CTERM sorting domain-containing protein [Pirellulales bacterium]
MSADGTVVVGFNQFSLNDTEAFRWTELDGMVGLGDLPGGRRISEAYDVSADGSVIVGMSENQDGRRAFYWTPQTGMLNLEDLLVSFGATNLDGWLLVEARGVSSDGFTLAGRGVHNGREEAWVATIPEPSTIVLAGLALLMLWALYLKRARRARRYSTL